jgi:hypothetical protein
MIFKKYRRRKSLLQKLLLFLFTKTILKKMKKYSLKPQEFLALKHEGDADQTINALEANSAGSADSVTFTEHDKSVTINDAAAAANEDGSQPKTSSILPGDYILQVSNEDGTCKGYTRIAAAIGDAQWVEEAA